MFNKNICLQNYHVQNIHFPKCCVLCITFKTHVNVVKKAGYLFFSDKQMWKLRLREGE